MEPQNSSIYPVAPPPYDGAGNLSYPSEHKGGPYPPSPMPTYQPQTQNPMPQGTLPSGEPAPVNPNPLPQQTTIVIGMPFGRYPVTVVCPNCQQSVVTEVVNRAGLLTWLLVGGLCLIGCGLGCCLIPFCVNDCQDADHMCPNCKSHLGTFKRV